MKKSKIASKSKMLMLLSLMFLSIAVLCMGVLAAESATYNIAGNISYNMVDYVARINTRVYKVEGQTNETGLATGVNTLSTMTFEQIEKSTTTPYYILSQKLDTGAITRTSDTTTEIAKSVEIEYGAVDSSVEYYTFYVVINIKEITGDYLLSASLNETISSSTKSYKYSNREQNDVLKSEIRNIVIGFSLIDSTANSSEQFTYTLTVKAKNWPIELKADITNSYWYVELGTYLGKAVRWKLVSADGTTKYTGFDVNNVPAYGDLKGKAIFVQMTPTGTIQFDAATTNSTSSAKAFTGSDRTIDNHSMKITCETSESTLFAGSTERLNVEFDTNYFTSNVRQQIRTGTLYNLEEDDLKNIVCNKKDLVCYTYQASVHFLYGTSEDSTTNDKDELGDYFWLLDFGEMRNLLSGTENDFGYDYWLRSKAINNGSASSPDICGSYALKDFSSYGNAMLEYQLTDYYIRAAFQLA